MPPRAVTPGTQRYTDRFDRDSDYHASRQVRAGGWERWSTSVLWIISGPSSVGKSTFLTRPRCAEVTGLSAAAPVVLASAPAKLDEIGAADAFYHYNILREEAAGAGGFAEDAAWRDLVRRQLPTRAIVLAASKPVIVRRMMQRHIVEQAALTGHAELDYPIQSWIDALQRTNLAALYAAWLQELRDRGIPYHLLNSEDDVYRPISVEELSQVLQTEHEAADATGEEASAQSVGQPVRAPRSSMGGAPGYTREEIEALLRSRRFAYHRVELPFGLHTGGEDRSQTRDIVLPPTLAGKSVLDVGSAIGYFCFEAEARGAARVLGVDLREDRHRDAALLKAIKGSNVEFQLRDVVTNPLTEAFDLVLLLNVIHHVKEPFRALRQLAAITRERLVIEFPTFADAKFRRTVEIADPGEFNRLPLVGVSSMAARVDQTFVFAPAAIERALLDHDPLFARIEFLDSPMPGRVIAVCHK